MGGNHQRRGIQSAFQCAGNRLENVPKGYDKEHPQAQYLKHKSWYLEYPVGDGELLNAESFLTHCVKIFRQMKPFNDYLNRALAGFQMPQR